MFDAIKDSIRDFLGSVYVREDNVKGLILVGGIDTKKMLADIEKIWGNTRVVKVMFIVIKDHSIIFDKFFGIDVLYIFGQIREYKKRSSNRFRCNAVINELRTNTWLRTLDAPHPDILDLTKLSEMFHTPYEHQMNAIVDYGKKVSRMALKGFLLAIDAGGGKTIASLAIATCLKAEIVIAIAPKSLAGTVWKKDIQEEFGADTKVWVSTEGKPLTDDFKYYVFNFEGVGKAFEFARRKSNLKSCIIVDESHNLNDVSTIRTQQILMFFKLMKCQNIIFNSGTPVKMLGYEVIPLLRAIDDLFTPAVEERFKRIFGISSKRAVDILRHRIDLISFKIPANVFMKVAPPIVRQVKIKLPNGKRFTVKAIQDEMKAYMIERMKYYRDNMTKYVAIYDNVIRTYAHTVKSKTQEDEFLRYVKELNQIRAGYDPVAHKDMLVFCNNFEKKKIMPILSSQMKVQFKDARSVVKYANLKVLGEALGIVLGRRRVECHSEMIAYSGLADIVKNADRKTLIFSSFVGVLKTADVYLRNAGFDPRMVYGETVKDVKPIVDLFKSDPTINPLLASVKTMNAGVTLTNCSDIVLTDSPFRQYLKIQMIARIFRMGASGQLYAWEFTLDTGSEPNISTRAQDILEESRKMASAIMGENLSTDTTIGIVRHLSMNPETNFEKAIKVFKKILGY